MSHPQVEPSIPHGPEGISLVGHRDYVGGLWNEMGHLQFEYMRRQGLQPHHVLFDVACGCLRGGVHFVPYLDAGNYFGIDKERDLIEAGLRSELCPRLRRAKRPTLVVSSDFDFQRFGARADFAVAQSLFTHLTPEKIVACLSRLRPAMQDGGLFCATFFEWHEPAENRSEPHDHGFFAYTPAQLIELGERAGWDSRYVGSWDHPRNQMMIHYRA